MTVESYKCYVFYEDGVFLEYNDVEQRAEFARYGRINEDNEKEYIEVGKTELEALIEQYKQYEKMKLRKTENVYLEYGEKREVISTYKYNDNNQCIYSEDDRKEFIGDKLASRRVVTRKYNDNNQRIYAEEDRKTFVGDKLASRRVITEKYNDNNQCVETDKKEFAEDKLIKQQTKVRKYIEYKGRQLILTDSKLYVYDGLENLIEEKDDCSLFDPRKRVNWFTDGNVLNILKSYIIDENNQRQLVEERKFTEGVNFVKLAEKEDEFKGKNDGEIYCINEWTLDDKNHRQLIKSKEILPYGMYRETYNDVELLYAYFYGHSKDEKNPCFRYVSKNYTLEMPQSKEGEMSKIILTQGDKAIELKVKLSCGSYWYLESPEIIEKDEKGVEKTLYVDNDFCKRACGLMGSIIEWDNYEARKMKLPCSLCERDVNAPIFKVRNEKHPDGTYREFNNDGILVLENLADGTNRKWDDSGKIIEENLPDGTHSTWEYSKGETVKTVVKDNETLKYVNGEYTGKTVVDGSITRYYNEENILEKEINVEEGTETYFYENGNKEKVLFNRRHFSPHLGIRAKYYAPNGELVGQVNSLGMAYTVNENNRLLCSMYKRAIAENDQAKAKEVLVLMCKGLSRMDTFFHSTQNSICVRNDCIRTKITDLGNGKVIFGQLLEDRDWAGKTIGYSGTEWRWKTQALIVDVENCGLVAADTIATTSVRDATSSKRDIWNKIDENASCFTIENGVLYTGLKAENQYGGQWYQKSDGINIEEVIAQYDKSRAEMIKEITLNKIQEYKESQKSANISDTTKEKTAMLRAILSDNVSKDPKTVNPKRSKVDKDAIRAAINEASRKIKT